MRLRPKDWGGFGDGPSTEREHGEWPKSVGYPDYRAIYENSHLNAPPGRAGFFTLVTLSGLIGAPLFGYIHGYTKRDCAFGDSLSHQRARHYRWGFLCRGARRSCRYESVS